MVKHSTSQADRLAAFKAAMIKPEWHETAARIDAMIASGDADETAAKRLAEEATGLSWGLMTRYLSAYRRVKAAARKAHMPPEALLSPAFNGVEAAVRLYDRSDHHGLQALQDLALGKTSLTEVRDTLKHITEARLAARSSDRGSVLRGRADQIGLIEEALTENADEIFGKDSKIRARPRLLYVRKPGFEVAANGAVRAGVDTYVSGQGAGRDRVDDVLPTALLLSTWFPAFYLACSPSTADEEAWNLVGALEIIGKAPWIGVLRVTADGDVETLREPKGLPVPNRTGQYAGLKAGKIMSVPMKRSRRAPSRP